MTRKSGESIRISSEIVVTVLDCNSGQVKIGITAPQEIPIHREEIYNQIQDQNRSALVSEELKPNVLNDLIQGLK